MEFRGSCGEKRSGAGHICLVLEIFIWWFLEKISIKIEVLVIRILALNGSVVS